MFDNLSQRLQETVKRVRGQGRLTEDNINQTLRDLRMALLEADVALPVAKAFIEEVKQKAMGQEVMQSLTPGQAFIKIVHDELIQVMGEKNDQLNLKARPPVVILMAGLQGAGKTTTVAKLARYLQLKEKKSVTVASADIYRPAAIQQLKKLALEVGAGFVESNENEKPVDIALHAVDQAKKQHQDVLILDTAGRLHIDDDMMDEIKQLHKALNPVETLFVIDSMTGQDAVNAAKAFNEALPLTGIVLTKTDGDARGGAALSVRQVTGKPIKFLGVGEKIDALEPFYPDRVASRILGMGDIVGLVEEVQQQLDSKQADKLAKKLKKGKGLDLNDFKSQLMQMQNMGGIAGLMDKMPGMGASADAAQAQLGEQQIKRTVAIIDSMTLQERSHSDIIRASRKRRIATGSGTQVQDVNRLLKQFGQMQKMMKRMGKGGLVKLMRGMKGGFPGMPS